MPDEYGERTEQPSDRRRSEARRKGNVARSVDLNAAGLMLAAALALWLFGDSLAQSLGELLAASLRAPGPLDFGRGDALVRLRDMVGFLAAGVFPVMLFMAVAALVLNFGQVGFLVAPDVLEPRLARLNPLEGAKRILSLRAIVKLLVSLAKLAIVVAIAAWSIAALLPQFPAMLGSEWQSVRSGRLQPIPEASGREVPTGPAEAGHYEPQPFREMAVGRAVFEGIRAATVQLAFWLALALFALGVADFGFQRWKHEQDLRMTKQEVREELKEMEGDPYLRQRRREAHRKLAQAREIARVPEADVVITNPTHIAVALKYNPGEHDAPVVVAKGMGEVAERIRRIAAEHGIPIIERRELARALYRQVKVGRAIPVEMYEVFVEIMAYVYRLTGRRGAGVG
jgi:flagellar biosynthesis protein FlhB